MGIKDILNHKETLSEEDYIEMEDYVFHRNLKAEEVVSVDIKDYLWIKQKLEERFKEQTKIEEAETIKNIAIEREQAAKKNVVLEREWLEEDKRNSAIMYVNKKEDMPPLWDDRMGYVKDKMLKRNSELRFTGWEISRVDNFKLYYPYFWYIYDEERERAKELVENLYVLGQQEPELLELYNLLKRETPHLADNLLKADHVNYIDGINNMGGV